MIQDHFAEFKDALREQESGYWSQNKPIERSLKYDKESLRKWICESADKTAWNFSHMTPEEQDEAVIVIAAALSLAAGAPIITVVGERIAVDVLLKEARQECIREHPNTSLFSKMASVHLGLLGTIVAIIATAVIAWIVRKSSSSKNR
jgi:hypothetical protein